MTKKYKEQAFQAFENKNFDLALKLYSLALKLDPNDIDLKIGAILSDYAKEDELDASIMFDFYTSSTMLGDDKETIYNEIIDSINYEDDFFVSLLSSLNSFNIIPDDGVEYKDLLEIAKQRGMKKTLQDIMFSSRILINSKEDMMDFISLLYKYDFKDEALSYLESAISIFPQDKYFEEKFLELSKRDFNWDMR